MLLETPAHPTGPTISPRLWCKVEIAISRPLRTSYAKVFQTKTEKPLFPPDIEPPGLLNPTGAEIHLLMHSHGQKIVEFMPEMIHTFGGGCVDPGPPFSGLWFPEWGPQGPNACVTEQVAIHASPDTP